MAKKKLSHKFILKRKVGGRERESGGGGGGVV